MSKQYRVRDAKTGRFVKKGTEERRPTTTVTETVKPKPNEKENATSDDIRTHPTGHGCNKLPAVVA